MSRTAKGWTAGVAVTLFLLWVMFAAIRRVQEDSSPVAKRPVSATANAASKDDLRIDAWLEDSRVDPNEPINYWIAVTNLTPRQADDVRVIAFKHPSFREDVAMTNRPAVLKPGEVATFEGRLVPSAAPGTYGVGAVIGWREGKIEHRTYVGVGPLTIENAAKRASLRALKTLWGILKDTALPILLGFVTILFARREKNREDREKRRQDHERELAAERENIAQAAETRRLEKLQLAKERTARIHQTWTIMLPRIHGYIEKYYMPLTSNAACVVKYYDGPDENRDICFYFYVLYLAQMKAMVDEINGFYLRHRIGEEIVATLWELLRGLADQRFTRPVREALQDKVKPLWTSADFDAALAGDAAARTEREKFVKDVAYKAFAAEIALFDMFGILLEYETNCCYEFWYEPEELPARRWQDAFDAVKRHFPEEKHASLIALLQEHRNHVRRRNEPPLRRLDGTASGA